MNIASNTIVQIEYTLRNSSGEVLDTSVGGEPLSYLHGGGQIVPGLERELEGLKVGDTKEVEVSPAEGYGERDPNGTFTVPRNSFPPDMSIVAGQAFVGESEEGDSVPVRIVEVRPDEVVVDANHPLAGETLFFQVNIKGVREATKEEQAHGHSHDGEGGHHH